MLTLEAFRVSGFRTELEAQNLKLEIVDP